MIKYLDTGDTLVLLENGMSFSSSSPIYTEVKKYCTEEKSCLSGIYNIIPTVYVKSDDISVTEYNGGCEIFYNGNYNYIDADLTGRFLRVMEEHKSFRQHQFSLFIKNIFKNPWWDFEEFINYFFKGTEQTFSLTDDGRLLFLVPKVRILGEFTDYNLFIGTVNKDLSVLSTVVVDPKDIDRNLCTSRGIVTSHLNKDANAIGIGLKIYEIVDKLTLIRHDKDVCKTINELIDVRTYCRPEYNLTEDGIELLNKFLKKYENILDFNERLWKSNIIDICRLVLSY